MLHLHKLYKPYISEENLGELGVLEVLESTKVYHYQYQKKMSVLVNFQDKANIV